MDVEKKYKFVQQAAEQDAFLKSGLTMRCDAASYAAAGTFRTV